MTSAPPLLEARNVGRRTPNGNWLLHEISLQIDAGSRTAIVGGTGCGKSVLLRSLARLDAINAGSIFWKGEKIHGHAVPRFRAQAIYVQQRPILSDDTVEEILRAPFVFQSHREKVFTRKTAISLLEKIDRDVGFLDRPARDLSGGESQIVALVRTLQLEPSILMLDEPTASLDQESTRAIEKLVEGWLSQSTGTRGVLWVSHDRKQVDRIADRVLHMRSGRILEEPIGTEE